MSITDELREIIPEIDFATNRDRLRAIADLIDMKHELGCGTCHITVQDNFAETEGMGDVWLECDACHWQMPLEPSTPRFNYCPNCGRHVVVGELW